MRRDARLLKSKAISSLRRAVQSFNSLDDDGKITTVLLHAEHASEMYLKAALRSKNLEIFDRDSGRSVGFNRCVNLAKEHLSLSDEAAGTLSAINALRDDEQHYIGCDDEGILYVHLRALVTYFDEALREQFGESLSQHLPAGMLPVSTMAPVGIDVLFDREFTQIQELLSPNRRRRAEAHGKIRTLLAMEAHATEDVNISERDVNRVEDGIRRGQAREDVFPKLNDVTSTSEGEGFLLKVHFSRKGEGAPVHYVGLDDPGGAAAIREVDLRNKYPHSRMDLANKLSLPTKLAKELRERVSLEDEGRYFYDFKFGGTSHSRYSDLALNRLREELQKKA